MPLPHACKEVAAIDSLSCLAASLSRARLADNATDTARLATIPLAHACRAVAATASLSRSRVAAAFAAFAAFAADAAADACATWNLTG